MTNTLNLVIAATLISSLEKPQIIDIDTSSDSTVEEGDRIVLECAAGGIPTPRISWQMAGGGVLPSGGRILQVSE